ncbi:hypothetical protein R1sor_025159 [Riccia sorocarpa]|uniref:SHSP domain-containing protein n=1 Tax=Riccia sorocarpa TaxID=122646 RepID=A0ABD3G9D0_9MARC
MAMIPRDFGGSIFDPFFGGSIFEPIETMSRALFDRAFPTTTSTTTKDGAPVTNTRVDIPGMKKEDVKVQVSDDGVLSISGERHKEKIEEKDTYRREERAFGKFFRQFRLPSDAKHQDICAKVDNGVLTVCVPKSEEAKTKSEVRNVEIAG